ncbi:hypothetical protein NEF87_002074 [Candidatus Lokiarchaeum ossiferum]|uniref:N-acetyltransferase domain-containing protein n=1 Tax=Candidatus Lokiarchaeum ossiferum TaxID=2951803 RepID=A0ABY6HQM2_9ARCH|nr:hypothetical protein NEF87_002074 [Candidatus Lokiarchaeum sp. B-35]
MDFRTLDTISVEQILEAHNDAFSEYEVPMEFPIERFEQINKLRGVNYNLSIGAFEDQKLVGFILNGVGEWNGVLTAYDCGTGVIQGKQGKGIGGEMFKHLTPILIQNKVRQYLLEVMKGNEPAIRLYKGKGFEVIRHFDCIIAEKEKIKFNIPDSDFLKKLNFSIITNPDWKLLKTFWDVTPSWQNSIDSIERLPNSFKIMTVSLSTEIIGYGVIEPRSGGILQIAIAPTHRKKKVGSKLLQKLIELSPNTPRIHLINLDESSKCSKYFFTQMGFESFSPQFEMSLNF